MSSTVVTYEHLTFPDLQPDEARRLQRRLEQVEYAARLFGSGLLGVDVELSWALGRSRPVQWVRAADGSLSVHIWLNLQSNRSRPEGVETGSMKAGDYVASFRTGFLHALGRALYSPNVWMYERAETAGAPGSVPLAIPAGSVGLGMGPLEWALRRSHPLRRTLPRSVRIALEEPEMRAALGGLFEELEDARVDGTLADSFAGSVRELAPRRRFLQERAAQEDPVVAFVSRVALALASKRGAAVAEGRDRGMTESLEAAIAGLRSTPDAAGAWPLAELLVFDLLPVLLSQEEALARLTEGFGAVGEGEVPQIAASPPSRHGMRFFRDREPSMDPIARPGARGTVVVALPRVHGGEALFRIDHAFAHQLKPDETNRRVLDDLAQVYGPRAEEAFEAELAPLRRALRVNWERRHAGRYRTGRHIGIPNLRRYLLFNDLRLFQRLEVPDTFSYYFHLLVDVSYSMLEHHNAAKALAAAYGFTELLRSFRVPVDVTLYSAGVTELFDHRKDPLERFFGADFGYLLSGTLEMEAVAYAKQKAAAVSERRKIFVVITDGTPFIGSLDSVEASDLHEYYAETFIPWLNDAGIEMLAIGVECDPAYHDRSVCLTESWDAVQVLSELIEGTVEEAEARSRQLWA